VQTFTVPCSLFSFLKISALRLASNSPLAILQQFFPFSSSFSRFSNLLPAISLHPKSLPQQKAKSQKTLASPFSESFIPSGKQGGGATFLGEACDIVIRETFLPASLNINNLGKAAVLHFPLLGGYANLSLQKHLRKSS
jgi:hypothetical protein